MTASREIGDFAEQQVILAEGNTSVSAGDGQFWIKASGAQLGRITESEFVALRSAPLLEAFDRSLSDHDVKLLLESATVFGAPRRPSVESFMHAWLLELPNVNAVVHTHPEVALADLCAAAQPKWVHDRIFPDEVVCCGHAGAWVPYVDPGLPLARAIAESVSRFAALHGDIPKIIALQNHGLIAMGETMDQALSAIRMQVKGIRVRQIAGQSYVPLTAEQVSRISSRPDEQYRQALLRQGLLSFSSQQSRSSAGQDQQ